MDLLTIPWVLAAATPATTDPFPLLSEAAAHREQGDYAAAIALQERARALAPDCVPVHLEGAATHAFAGNLEAALQWYRSAARLDPTSGPAARGVARLLHWTGRFEASEEAWRARLAATPEDDEAALGLGRLLEELDRRREARGWTQRLSSPEARELVRRVAQRPVAVVRAEGGLVAFPSSPEPAPTAAASIELRPGRGLQGRIGVRASGAADPAFPRPAGVSVAAAFGGSRGDRLSLLGGAWLRFGPEGSAGGGSMDLAGRPPGAAIGLYARAGVDESKAFEAFGSWMVTPTFSGPVSIGVGLLGAKARSSVFAGQVRVDLRPPVPMRLGVHLVTGPRFDGGAVLPLASVTVEPAWTPPWGAVSLRFSAQGAPLRLEVVPTITLELPPPKRPTWR